jgi:spermidine synthase
MEPAIPQAERRIIPVLYLLFFASGFSALVYQVVWMRSFSLVFGSGTRAASAVLASFFLGMAIGNLLGGRWARGRSRALLAYGLVELGIAAGALVVIPWLELYRANYPLLYDSALGRGAGLVTVQLLLAFVSMAPPCIAMGATLPIISQAVVTRTAHLSRRVGAIYAINTVGATLGVLLSGFLLPRWIGYGATVSLAVAINVLVGVASLGLWRRERRGSEAAADTAPAFEPQPASAEAPKPAGLDRLLYFAAAASGFGTLALEVLFVRLLVNRADSSVHSFAVILAVFLVSLALGSLGVSALADRLRNPWRLVAGSASLAALCILLTPRSFWDVTTFLSEFRSDWGYLRWLLVVSALLVAPSAILCGMTLPTVWKIATRRVGEVGERIGSLTSLNTLAAVVGSLAAGFLIIPVLGLNLGFGVVALLYAVVAVLSWVHSVSGPARIMGPVALALGLTLVLGAVDWDRLPLRMRDGEHLSSYYEGESGTVAVTRGAQNLRNLRINNRYFLGSSDATSVRAQRSQGRLGLALLGEPRSAAFIGVGTGITLSAVLEFPTLERVLAMELVPGVVEAASAFEPESDAVLRDPLVEVVIADARNHLFGSSERFDVVVGDLFVPWHSGTAYLYTTEHFENVRERLTERGIFVQWIQADQVAQEELRIITATFLDVFVEGELWAGALLPKNALLGLVGRTSPVVPTEGAAGAPVADPGGMEDLIHLCDDAALRRWSGSAPRNTDDHPIIEFLAAESHLGRAPSHSPRLLRFLQELCASDPGSPQR